MPPSHPWTCQSTAAHACRRNLTTRRFIAWAGPKPTWWCSQGVLGASCTSCYLNWIQSAQNAKALSCSISLMQKAPRGRECEQEHVWPTEACWGYAFFFFLRNNFMLFLPRRVDCLWLRVPWRVVRLFIVRLWKFHFLDFSSSMCMDPDLYKKL